MMDSNLTADSELISTLHDRQRRAERQVDKITLLEARRYGMAENQLNGRIRYTYAGHVFIYDPLKNKAITSWKIRGKKKEATSGSKFYKPIHIQESSDHNTNITVLSHDVVAMQVQNNMNKWTSHTVLVVDMSGSMRDDDVDGARCRSDGVWTTLARDFVKAQLELKACSIYDVVSVIVMQEKSRVVIECEPLTYVLYNKLVKLREWENMRPEGHGMYKPALTTAKKLLSINTSGRCSLTLMFLSDGKPSDYYASYDGGRDYDRINDELVEITGGIASHFGRRLNIHFIGMAGQNENFVTMERMTKEAKSYGAQAFFNRPKLNAGSLSKIMTSSLVSSLSSKLEISSSDKNGVVTTRSVRTDVKRERQNAPDDEMVTNDWRVFLANSDDAYVRCIWAWNEKVRDFARVIDRRCQICYKEVLPTSEFRQKNSAASGKACEHCSCCFFCSRCVRMGHYDSHRRSTACAIFAKERRQGFYVGLSSPFLTYSVAWKQLAFGEGAERLAFKFRFLDENKKFVGPIMVAKESRFAEDLDQGADVDYLMSNRQSYHRSFMRTQSIASNFAKQFNSEVEQFAELADETVPTIFFIAPLIFELEDALNAKTYNVLVEPLIQGKYQKFTDNFGALRQELKRDFASENEGVNLFLASQLLGREQAVIRNATKGEKHNLDAIEEGSEEEEEEESSDERDDERSLVSEHSAYFDVKSIRDNDYLDAFSHFTYARSGGTLMVVDLQGALDKTEDKITFVLTDPAIHHKQKRNDKIRRFGRTDLGKQGMRAFFETHKCNEVCRLFGFKEKRDQTHLDRVFGPIRAAMDHTKVDNRQLM